LEIGYVSILRWGGGRDILCWVHQKEMTSHPLTWGQKHPVSKTVFWNTEQSSKSESLCFLHV
jgi:hypothetical protein